MILTCPNCNSVLSNQDKAYRCEEGHSFDVSKEGYINLLLANQKKKLNPGDNKEMINARENFLIGGHYDFLIAHINALLKEQFNASTEGWLLDVGCGSGYYTRNMDVQLGKIGMDISKNAISKAAKNDKLSTYIIGSAFKTPVLDNSVDILMNVFSPLDLTEARRVLKDGGYLLKVVPGANHMKEVAMLAYDTFEPHSTSFIEDVEGNKKLKFLKEDLLERSVHLDKEQLLRLIDMTPYRYRFSDTLKKGVLDMEVTFSFRVMIVLVC